ncbi:MAG TPA: recombinase family protein [Woeseiaceae bacterium]|nr:recombinase family protein [Woeseiaceae bacterium]
MTNRIVIGYCRVSTKAQGSSGLGLEAQQQAIERYCAVYGHTMLRVDFEVASGKLPRDQRPLLDAALTDAKKQGLTVIVAKLCRLSRDSLLVKQLMRSGVSFEDADSGPDAGNLMLGLKAEFNEEERRKISERTKAALAAKKARGEPLGNLENLKVGAIRGREVQRQRALEVAERYRAVLAKFSGLSFRAIARELNRGMVSPPYGSPWTHNNVGRLMKRLELV